MTHPFILVCAAWISCASPTEELAEKYLARHYFDLRDALDTFEGEESGALLFYRGAVSNKFNELAKSTAYLETYLDRADDKTELPFVIEAQEMLADNYFKVYQYRKAAEAYGTLIDDLGDEVDPEDLADYRNSRVLCQALKEIPPQELTLEESTAIQAAKNRPGFFAIDFDGKEMAFIFDTGANLSLTVTSAAQDLGLNILDSQIEVETSTGDKIGARLAVASQMRIGMATFRNVVFLVVPDEVFHLDGIIGFPVIEALQEVTFVGNKEIRVSPEPKIGLEQNMALTGLTPLIAGEYGGRRLPFRFDTGANKSHLYPPFLEAFEQEVKRNSVPETETFAGVGSKMEIPAYAMKDVRMIFSGNEVRFPEIKVLREYTVEGSRDFYGNLGLDLVSQFKTMTLNFKSMSIIFE